MRVPLFNYMLLCFSLNTMSVFINTGNVVAHPTIYYISLLLCGMFGTWISVWTLNRMYVEHK